MPGAHAVRVASLLRGAGLRVLVYPDADKIGKRHPAVGPVAFDTRDALVEVFRLMSETAEPGAGLVAATDWLARIAARTYRAADKAVGRARSDLTRLAANTRLLGVAVLHG